MFRIKRWFSTVQTMTPNQQPPPSRYPFFSLLFLYIHTNWKCDDLKEEIRLIKISTK
jgi:hypothetical protein